MSTTTTFNHIYIRLKLIKTRGDDVNHVALVSCPSTWGALPLHPDPRTGSPFRTHALVGAREAPSLTRAADTSSYGEWPSFNKCFRSYFTQKYAG